MFDPYLEWLKIPADRRPPTHYELLGLPAFESDASRIHAAAMERMALVRRYQLGDRSDQAIRLLGELSSAFDCVSDPARRCAYDERLRVAGDNSLSESPPLPAAPLPVHPASPLLRARARPNWRRSPGVWLAAAALAASGIIALVWFSNTPTAVPQSNTISTKGTPRTPDKPLPLDAADDKEPAAPATRDPQIRYFGYATAGPPGVIGEIARYTNVVLVRDWVDHSNEVIVAAQQAGLPMVLCLNNNEMAERGDKLEKVLSRRADAVLAVCWFNPYAAGHTRADVASFGRQLKRDHPQVQYWVAELAKPPGQIEVGSVPPVVDVLVIIGVARQQRQTWCAPHADECLPGWAEKAAGRPLLWYWVSGMRGSQGGVVPTTERGTFRACLDAARRHNLAGVIFDRYGQPPWQERVPIDSRPEMVAGIRRMAGELGLDKDEPGAASKQPNQGAGGSR